MYGGRTTSPKTTVITKRPNANITNSGIYLTNGSKAIGGMTTNKS